MLLKKFVIFSRDNNPYYINWASYVKDFTFITSHDITDFILNMINKKINIIKLNNLMEWFNGEIRVEYVENKNNRNILLKFNSIHLKVIFSKNLVIDNIYVKKNTDLRRLINSIELEILKQCPHNKNLVLISDSIKKTPSNSVYLLAIYSSNKTKNDLKTILADYYIDSSLSNWTKSTIKVLLSKLKSKPVGKYFSIINYKKFFANQEKNAQIEEIRDYIHPKIIDIATNPHDRFDQLDLEIQTLIASTWLDKNELYLEGDRKLNFKILDILIYEQLSIIQKRYKNFNNKLPVKELLTPGGIFKSKTRYWYDKNKIFAVPVINGFVDKQKAIEVEFRKVDSKIASNYELCFHYIHNDRRFSTAFGLFVKGSKYPYAISILDFLTSRNIDYKIRFLNQAGIDQNQCVDEIRLYSFPWVPMLTSSLLAKLVREYFIINFPNITTSITAVNRNLFKGTYIIQAGYIPLALKPTIFSFEKTKIDDKTVKFYQGSTGKSSTNSPFSLLPTVEYYRPIKKILKVNIPEGKVFKILPHQAGVTDVLGKY